jgi:hypothetical protein
MPIHRVLGGTPPEHQSVNRSKSGILRKVRARKRSRGDIAESLAILEVHHDHGVECRFGAGTPELVFRIRHGRPGERVAVAVSDSRA